MTARKVVWQYLVEWDSAQQNEPLFSRLKLANDRATGANLIFHCPTIYWQLTGPISPF